MSFENEDWNALEEIPETRKVKYSYSRDFLLSLSELEVCKKLPSGFDQSIVSEFEDALQDRPRNVGAFSLSSFRRDYGSSPPSKGELSGYSKGPNGRWESHSSGRSDKDNDSLSGWDSESGRRCDSQSRRSWKNPEHDGLLGSGSFPRPSGFVSGASAPKFNSDDRYKLNKTSEPYHPPRPYKAIRRENNDSYNNETFGSSESTSEDKVEEEKKRRASFETMRKEQHEALQQKQNLTEGKHGDNLDVTVPLEDSVDEKKILLNRSSESDDPFVVRTSTNDMEKSSFQSQILAVRPLVPPGFSNTMMERNSGTKFGVHSHLAAVGNSKLDDKLVQSESNDLLNEKFNYLGDNQPTIESDLRDKQFRKRIISEPQQVSLEFFERSKKGTGNSGAVQNNQGHSTSVLEPVFGNHLTLDDGSLTNLVQHDDGKGVDTWNRLNPQSSKFAQWFLEEEKRPLSNVLVNEPNEILSLIARNEKSGHEVSDVESTHCMEPSFPLSSCNEKQTACAIPPSVVKPDQLHDNSKVLTCADLEQTILLEIRESGPNSLPSGSGWRIPESDAEQIKSSIDNHASQHLLSLLQKEVDDKNTPCHPSNTNKNRSQGFEEAKTDAKSSLGETLTLETIFGTAFMRELQSVGAPVSVQAGVESQRLPSQIIDGIISSGNGSGSHMNSHESRVLASNHRHQNIDSSTPQTGFGSKNSAFHDLQHFISPMNAQVDTAENLSRDGRSIGAGQQGSFFGGPYDLREAVNAFQNLNIQPSSSHFHPTQMNPLMKFMMPENPSSRDPPLNHLFHPNMLHPPFLRPNTELVGFDPSSHNPLLSQVQVPGNLPPHLLQGLSRGGSLPRFANQGNPQHPHIITRGSSLPQMNNQIPGFAQELNSRQGFRIGQQQQPNSGSLGSEAAAQRLLEMELRSNLKKNNHFYGGGHSWGDNVR